MLIEVVSTDTEVERLQSLIGLPGFHLDQLVSVILPAYNAEQYIELAVVSVLSQSYQNIEVIAIDDGSTDGTYKILSQLADKDHRLKLVSRENRGLVATLNEGLYLANGTYIARMDADDIAYRDRFSQQVTALHSDQDLSMVAMNVDYLYEDGRTIRKPSRSALPDECRVECMFHCMFVHPTVMIRSSSMHVNGWAYDKDFPYCEDFALWSRVVREGRAAILPHFGLAWRQGHPSVRSTRFQRAIHDSLKIIEGNMRSIGIAFDIDCFHPFPQKAVSVERSDRVRITMLLNRIKGNRSSHPQCADAFDRGIASLINNLIEASLKVGQPAALLKALTSTQLFHEISIKQWVRHALRIYPPHSLAEQAFRAGQIASRRFNGRPIKDVVALSPETRALLSYVDH